MSWNRDTSAIKVQGELEAGIKHSLHCWLSLLTFTPLLTEIWEETQAVLVTWVWWEQGELEGGRNCFWHSKEMILLLMYGANFLLDTQLTPAKKGVYTSLWNYGCYKFGYDQHKSGTLILSKSQFLPPSNSPWMSTSCRTHFIRCIIGQIWTQCIDDQWLIILHHITKVLICWNLKLLHI